MSSASANAVSAWRAELSGGYAICRASPPNRETMASRGRRCQARPTATRSSPLAAAVRWRRFLYVRWRKTHCRN